LPALHRGDDLAAQELRGGFPDEASGPRNPPRPDPATIAPGIAKPQPDTLVANPPKEDKDNFPFQPLWLRGGWKKKLFSGRGDQRKCSKAWTTGPRNFPRVGKSGGFRVTMGKQHVFDDTDDPLLSLA
jgi:hypothetical protein